MKFCWVLVTGQFCAADCLSQTTDLPWRPLACLPACLRPLLPVSGPGEQMLSCYVQEDLLKKLEFLFFPGSAHTHTLCF